MYWYNQSPHALNQFISIVLILMSQIIIRLQKKKIVGD